MQDREPIKIPLLVVGAEDAPIYFSNFMLVQHIDKEFILTFAQYSPPVNLGDGAGEDRVPSYIPVKPVARVGLTPDRLRELIEILRINYNKWSETQGGD